MLYAYELKKLFINNHLFIVIIIFLIANVFLGISHTQNYSIDPVIYKSYVERWQGVMDDQKRREIDEEYQRINEIIESEAVYTQRYLESELSEEEFNSYCKELWEAKNFQPVMEYIYQKVLYFDFINEYSPVLFYDIELETYLAGMGIDWLHLIMLLSVSTVILTEEYRTGAYQILLTTKNGYKKSFSYKVIILALFAATFTIINICLNTAIICSKYDIGSADAPIQSMMTFGNYNPHLTVAQLFVSLCVVRIVYSISLCIVVLGLSTVFRNAVTLSAVNLALIGIPYLLRDYMPDWLNSSAIIYGFDGHMILSREYILPNIPNTVYSILLVVAISSIAILCGKRFFNNNGIRNSLYYTN